MFANIKFALRSFLKAPGFTAVAVLTLALCIGANVVIFAVVDAILIRSLPFPEPDRLVVVVNSYPGAGSEHAGASLPNYYDQRVAIKAFASTALYQSGSAAVDQAGAPNRIDIARVSPEFFATLGVPLAMGRAFNDGEMVPEASHVAILTHAFWRNQFNGDPHVLGRKFRVDSQSTVVIGVLPPGFRYLSSKAQFFTPAASYPWQRGADQRHTDLYQLIARLAPDATLSAAQSQIDAFNVQQIKDDPVGADVLKAAGYRTDVQLLHADHVREVRSVLLILQGGVLFLLLIGGVNLVNLLLIRASVRSREFAIRQAMGARRWHVARDVMMETTLLAVAGGALGLAFGASGIRLLTMLGTNQLPLGAAITLDGRVAAVTVAASLAVGVVLALPVLWYTLRAWLAPVLQSEGREGTVSITARRMRHGFIVTQVALAFVLLAGAGLLALSLRHVLATTPGFHPDHILTGRLSLPSQNYPDADSRRAVMGRMLGALRVQPGITAAGVTSDLPMTSSSNSLAVAVEGVEPLPGESIQTHYVSSVSAGYFQTLRVPLLQGHFFDEADDYRDRKVCIVDETFAHHYWPDRSALGRRLGPGQVKFMENAACTIVGVVGHIKQTGLAEQGARGSVYYSYGSNPVDPLSIVLRTPLAPESLAPSLKRAVLQIDSELPIDQLKPMQSWIDESLVSRRSPALLAGIFAGIALLLAAIGTYGVLAYAVDQRRREIGVRMALGAQPRKILTHFLGLSVKLLIAGLLFGLLGAWLAGRAMQSLLFGVSAFQADILVATAAVMTVVVLLATFLPSRRASRVDPLVALRAE